MARHMGVGVFVTVLVLISSLHSECRRLQHTTRSDPTPQVSASPSTTLRRADAENSIPYDDRDCRQTSVPTMTSSQTRRLAGRGQRCRDDSEVAERTATTLRTRRYAATDLHRHVTSGRVSNDREGLYRRAARLFDDVRGLQRPHTPNDRLSNDGSGDQSTSEMAVEAMRSDSGAVTRAQRNSGGRRQVQVVNGPHWSAKRRIVDGTSQCIQTYCPLAAPVLDRFACILRFCNRSTRRSLTMMRVATGAR